MRTRRSLPLALGLTLLCAAPALACINDRDVEGAEREFRGRYEDRAPAEDEPQPERVTAGAYGPALGIGGVVAGLALFGGALARAAKPAR